MSKLTKNQKLVADKIEAGKAYTLAEAATLVKEITTTKFDASLDIDVRLGVDPRKANQMVRGVGNAKEFISTIMKLKPTTVKGTYIKSIYLSSTMSRGIKIDVKSVVEN